MIPCLNEANSIGICVGKALEAFRAAGLRGEVVVADNGSTDGSIEIAEKLGARVVRVPQRGYGSALRAGIAAARGAFIIMGDADDSYDFSEVPRFVEMWRQGYDVVMGNRFRGEIKPGAMPWHHKYIGNPVLSRVLNLFFHAGIGDSHCGMRGFTRAVYDRMDLRSTGMEFASEFVIKAAQLRAKVTEIPITLWPDKRGRPPHLRSFRDGWRHLRFMLLYAPNWLFLLPGASLVVVGIVSGVLAVARPARVDAARDAGRAHHDFWRDVHAAGRADSVDRSVREGVQLCGALRSQQCFAEARADARDAGIRAAPRRRSVSRWDSRAAPGWCGTGWPAASVRCTQVRAVLFWSMWLFIGIQVTFRFVFPQHAGHQPRHVHRRLRPEIDGVHRTRPFHREAAISRRVSLHPQRIACLRSRLRPGRGISGLRGRQNFARRRRGRSGRRRRAGPLVARSREHCARRLPLESGAIRSRGDAGGARASCAIQNRCCAKRIAFSRQAASLIMTWPSAMVDPILRVLHGLALVSDEMESDQHQKRIPVETLRRCSSESVSKSSITSDSRSG